MQAHVALQVEPFSLHYGAKEVFKDGVRLNTDLQGVLDIATMKETIEEQLAAVVGRSEFSRQEAFAEVEEEAPPDGKDQRSPE